MSPSSWRRVLVALALLLLGSPSLCAAPTPVPDDLAGDWEVRWDRTFAGWWPPIFEGLLHLERAQATWSGTLRFKQSTARLVLQALTLDGNQVTARFAATPGFTLDFSGWLRDGRLIGEMRTDGVAWTPLGGRRVPELVAHAVPRSLPTGEPTGLDAAALHELLVHAANERSSAVVIVHDGKIVVERYRAGYDGGPLVAMSASKSIVSLAVGLLVADGKLTLDAPVATWFPEWKSDARRAITVRHLLTQTSGLDPGRARFDEESIREHALAAKLVFPPGTRFQYNNGAVDFLAAVVGRVAGRPLDEFLDGRLLRKLDITDAHWMKDREGTPRGAGELFIRPVDLAKLGQLMLDGGAWKGEQLLPRDWVAMSVAASQRFDENYGLLWWREGSFADVLTDGILDAWSDAGIDAALVAKVRPLVGKRMHGWRERRTAFALVLGETELRKLDAALARGNHIPTSETVADGPVVGFSARGWLGQQLVVLPSARLVAVRMRAPEGRDYGSDVEPRDADASFVDDVRRLVPGLAPGRRDE